MYEEESNQRHLEGFRAGRESQKPSLVSRLDMAMGGWEEGRTEEDKKRSRSGEQKKGTQQK